MADDVRPVVVAYDGSAAAREAMEVSAQLFSNHRLVVVSVWEPGLALELSVSGVDWAATAPPDLDESVALDRARHDHAGDVAEQGVKLAQFWGATAEAASVADVSDIARTIATVAAERDACVVVVGSRGLGAVKSRLFGSTSRGVLESAACPVLVVTAREDHPVAR